MTSRLVFGAGGRPRLFPEEGETQAASERAAPSPTRREGVRQRRRQARPGGGGGGGDDDGGEGGGLAVAVATPGRGGHQHHSDSLPPLAE